MRNIFLFLLLSFSGSLFAQCDHEDVLRADGVLVTNYAYARVVENDTLRINMALSYLQGSYNLLLRFRYLDSTVTNPRKPYGTILLKLSDSTVVEAVYISGSKEITLPRFVCQYDLHKKDLGYLEKYEIVYFDLVYKKGKQRQRFKMMSNKDILNKQLECVRRR